MWEQAGRDYSESRMCIIAHTPPEAEVQPKFFILNSLFTLPCGTPPMLPPQLARGGVDVQVEVQVELLGEEH